MDSDTRWCRSVRLAACIAAGSLVLGAWQAAQGGSVTYLLDQSHRLADGVPYLQVTISEAANGDIDFRIDSLGTLTPASRRNFGIQRFAFNLNPELALQGGGRRHRVARRLADKGSAAPGRLWCLRRRPHRQRQAAGRHIDLFRHGHRWRRTIGLCALVERTGPGGSVIFRRIRRRPRTRVLGPGHAPGVRRRFLRRISSRAAAPRWLADADSRNARHSLRTPAPSGRRRSTLIGRNNGRTDSCALAY